MAQGCFTYCQGFFLCTNSFLFFYLQRYFILDKGSLMYAKRSADLARGKPHGSVDLGLSVISAKRRRCRIDIDAEVFIYHIKVRPRKKKTFFIFLFNRFHFLRRR